MELRKYLNVKNYIAHAKYVFSKQPKTSYAQNGEDIIINSALTEYLGVSKPSYLDIGTYLPVYSNNTYLFYKKGGKGVCVEPDPQNFKKIKNKRRRDVCLNVGIGPENAGSVDYYVMSSKYLNTFKKEDADWHVARGKQKIEQVQKVPLVSINSILEEHFPKGVDILSIDTEGYDLEILNSLDFIKYSPKLLCVETLRYDASGHQQKVTEIGELLKQKGYELFADTHVNSIFIKI